MKDLRETALAQREDDPNGTSSLRRCLGRWFWRHRHFEYRGFGSSRIGSGRSVNADVFQIRNDLGLYVVADGFGEGHSGEEAAVVGVDRFVERFFELSAVSPVSDDAHSIPLEVAQRLLVQSFVASAGSVNGFRQRCDSQCGASMTAIVCTLGSAIFGSIGNCRGYLLRQQKLKQITADDTVAAELELLESGSRTNLTVQYQKILSKHLGDGNTMLPRTSVVRIRDDDRLLLLTDGVYRALDRSCIGSIVSSEPIMAASRRLVTESDRSGTGDDCAAVLVSAKSLSEAPATEQDTNQAEREYNFTAKQVISMG